MEKPDSYSLANPKGVPVEWSISLKELPTVIDRLSRSLREYPDCYGVLNQLRGLGEDAEKLGVPQIGVYMMPEEAKAVWLALGGSE